MASLYIDFGYDDNVKRSINSAKRAINSRISDYNGIINSVNNTSSETSNLWNANTYIKRKRDKLQSKWDKLDRFHGKIDSFNEYASDKDKAVADRIKEETNDFYKRENIKTGFLYTVGCVVSDGWKWIKGVAETVWDAVCTGAKAVWKTIKEFYENNKYWIDLVVDLVVVVAAVAALIASGGAVAAIFATWGLMKASADLFYDGAAFKAYYIDKDEKKAAELSEKGMKDVCEYVAGDYGAMFYSGMEIASCVYNVCKIASSAKTIFKDFNKLYKNDHLLTAKLSNGLKKEIIVSDIKSTLFKTIGVQNLDAATGQNTVTNIISGISWGFKTTQAIVSSDNLGDFSKKTIKIVSVVDKGYSNAKDLVGKISEKCSSNKKVSLNGNFGFAYV